VSGRDEQANWWFDEPIPGDLVSWAVPAGHGTYQGMDLERLDPADDDDRALLLEAQHPELQDALRDDKDMVVDCELINPRLHVAMHQVVANQLVADEPPETWQTVQRLARQGYDWHNIMHMVAALVTEDVHYALQDHRPYDLADYVRRLNELPGDWPPPERLNLQ